MSGEEVCSPGAQGGFLPPLSPQSESRHSNRNHFCGVCLGKGQGMWLQKRAVPLGGAGRVSCLPPEGTGPGSHAGHGEGRKAAVPPAARGQAQGTEGSAAVKGARPAAGQAPAAQAGSGAQPEAMSLLCTASFPEITNRGCLAFLTA